MTTMMKKKTLLSAALSSLSSEGDRLRPLIIIAREQNDSLNFTIHFS